MYKYVLSILALLLTNPFNFVEHSAMTFSFSVTQSNQEILTTPGATLYLTHMLLQTCCHCTVCNELKLASELFTATGSSHIKLNLIQILFPHIVNMPNY